PNPEPPNPERRTPNAEPPLRLRPEYLVYRHGLDRPEIQRADARLDRLHIADDHDGHPIGVQVFLRDALSVGDGHRLDVLHVLREVVVRQVIDERVFEPPRDVAGGLEGRWIPQRDVILRAGELVG